MSEIFAWYDYILFILIIIVSASIGIYYGCFGSKQDTKEEYLIGGKAINPLSAALSLIACNNSAELLLAIPSEVHRNGAFLMLEIISMTLVCIITIYVYLPVFHKLQCVTVYEYLEKRFDRKTRQLASLFFILNIAFYLSVCIYTPALTLSAASGLKTYFIVPIVSTVCILYTSIGGFRTVIWTDTFLTLVTFGVFLTLFVIGLNSVGGIAVTWTKAFESGRLNIFDFDPDPTKRDSFWTVSIGLVFFSLSYTSVDQASMQKVLSTSTFKNAALSLIFYTIGTLIIDFVCIMLGLILYTRYSDCDPFLDKAIDSNDQLLPYFVAEIAKSVPGLPGIFVAGIFSSSLSLQAAILNCLAGTIYEDFLSKYLKPNISENKVSSILKGIVVIVGIICTTLVILVSNLGGIFSTLVTTVGVFSGTILGIFTLGILFIRANSKGAFYGGIFGLLVTLAVVAPAKYYESQGFTHYSTKPLSTAACLSSFSLNSSSATISNLSNLSSKNQPNAIFRLSFYYHTAIAFVCATAFGLIISYLTNKHDSPVQKELISPICHFLLPKQNKIVKLGENTCEETELMV